MKKIISIILVVSLICGMGIGVSAISGEGSATNPYVISTPEELLAVSDNLSAHYQLSADIDMSSVKDFEPIGNAIDGAFTGSFDGNGFAINNLTVNAPGEKYAGLFGYSEGNIYNLTLNNANIIGGRYVGGIAAYSGTEGSINNCIVDGNITSQDALIDVNIGGIAGVYFSDMSGCKTYGTIKNLFTSYNGEYDINIGGIIGLLSSGSVIKNIENSSDIYVSENSHSSRVFIGGIVGYTKQSIKIESAKNCGNLELKESVSNSVLGGITGYITDNFDLYLCSNFGDIYDGGCVGGLIGECFGSTSSTIIECHNNGNIRGTYGGTGGLIGNVYRSIVSISKSYNNGRISGSEGVGGLIGKPMYDSKIIIDFCYNNGDISGFSYSGGLIGGENKYTDSTVTITKSYNSGYVNGIGNWCGGLIGFDYDSEISYCYNIGLVQFDGSNEVGGLVGYSVYGSNIFNCYNSGKIVCDNTPEKVSPFGARRGYESNSYYLNESTYKRVEGCLTDAQMKDQTNYNWDFENVWYIDPSMNNGYPLLRCFMDNQYAMDKSYAALAPGENVTLTAKHNGETISDVYWESSDISVATVSQNGQVKAFKAGNITVTAKTKDGNKMNCCISVVEPCGGISISDAETKVNEFTEVSAVLDNPLSNEPITDWQSSDESVATVAATGETSAKILGVSLGTCQITATTLWGKTVTFNVNVTAYATEISLPTTAELNRGETITLLPEIAPSPTQSILSWSSSDESIATVDENGIVTGVDIGKAAISVETDTGYSAVCTVTVYAPAERLTMERSSITVTKGFTDKVVAIPNPIDTTDTITYSSSNRQYVSVDSDTGVIIANRAGSSTITATSTSGKTAYCVVTVVDPETPVTGITLNTKEINIHIGEQTTLSPSVLPEDSTNRQITWSIEDSSIATITQTGVVKGVSIGSTVVTATTKDGNYSVSCKVNVVIDPTSVEINKTQAKLKPSETIQLEATVIPVSATNQTVVWSSDDSRIASVDENGLVTAISNGTANITATIKDTNLSSSCRVTVEADTYTITWIVDDESFEQQVAEATAITLPETPEKPGYTFADWSPTVPETMPPHDLKFTATWVANKYNAVFYANGGVWSDGLTEKTVSYEFDSEIISPEVPVRNGYSFSGWELNGKTLNTSLGIMDSVKGKKFTAVWTKLEETIYTVETYTMNTAGEYEKDSQTFNSTAGENISITPDVSNGFTLNSRKSVLSGTVEADNSLVLKVYIDRNYYTLTTVIDGNTTSTTYLYGSIISKPNVPCKAGYKFIEWRGKLPDTMPAENVTITAVFEASYICPVCQKEIIGEKEINNHIAAEEKEKLNPVIRIKNNSGSKTINYGETLTLTAVITDKPADTKIYWYVDGIKKGEGETFNISFENGTKTVEVKIIDSNGNVLKNASGNEIKDSESVTVKGGFFQKIISFFKNLFGMNRTVIQSIFKGTF